MTHPSNRLLLAFPHGGFLAHTVRLVEISKALRRRGFRIVFLTQGRYSALIDQAGFEVHDIFCLDPDAILERLRYGDVEFYSQATYQQSVQCELEAFKRYNPICVLGDHRWSLRSSSEIACVPYVSVLNASWTRFWELPLRPYYHHPLMRTLGGGRVARALVDPILPWVAGLFKTAGAREQNRWRAQNKLREYAVHLESFEGDLNLLADVPEYAPCKDLPHNFIFIGPLFWEPAGPPPEWLRKVGTERPAIYLTFGSTGLPHYFAKVLALLRDRDVDVVVTTGGLARIEHPPPNCRVAEILPGSAVLKVADAMVCHGGNGTIYQALTEGVPVVGIPSCITQEIEMDQVERVGCGIQINEVRFRSQDLGSAIERVLSDPVFTTNSQRLGDIIRPYRPRKHAAESIMRFLG